MTSCDSCCAWFGRCNDMPTSLLLTGAAGTVLATLWAEYHRASQRCATCGCSTCECSLDSCGCRQVPEAGCLPHGPPDAILRQMRMWVAEHGPIYSAKTFQQQSIVVLNDLQVIREVFLCNADALCPVTCCSNVGRAHSPRSTSTSRIERAVRVQLLKLLCKFNSLEKASKAFCPVAILRKAAANISTALSGSNKRAGSPEACTPEAAAHKDLFFPKGLEPVSNVLSWALLCVISRPDVQARCAAEIFKVTRGRMPQLLDQRCMPYVEATIREVMRRFAITPFRMSRCTSRDIALTKGYTIPASTTVVCNQHFVHMSDLYWVEPENFSPDRWLDTTDCNRSAPVVKQYDSFIAFGIGAEVCAAEQQAWAEMFLLFTGLLQRFQLLPEDRCDICRLEDLVDVGFSPPSFSLRLKVRFCPFSSLSDDEDDDEGDVDSDISVHCYC